MKKILKKKFPSFFNLLKNMYINTAYYKNKLEKLKEVQRINKEKREQEESKIMNDVFDNEYVVCNGPFKGMKYIKRSSGSALLPKILGSYEESIQGWIREVIENKKYENILDIGSAEGYYACGFAMRMPVSKITAYDIDKDARKNLNELKKVNGLTNIEIKSECTHEELNSKSTKNTLVFCDIEGFEKYLLDPQKVPNLKHVDIIVESHDFIVPGITDELINRFYASHVISLVIDYPFRVKSYIIKEQDVDYCLSQISDEKRPSQMKFLFLKAIK
jgi:hypothetical protein